MLLFEFEYQVGIFRIKNIRIIKIFKYCIINFYITFSTFTIYRKRKINIEIN